MGANPRNMVPTKADVSGRVLTFPQSPLGPLMHRACVRHMSERQYSCYAVALPFARNHGADGSPSRAIETCSFCVERNTCNTPLSAAHRNMPDKKHGKGLKNRVGLKVISSTCSTLVHFRNRTNGLNVIRTLCV